MTRVRVTRIACLLAEGCIRSPFYQKETKTKGLSSLLLQRRQPWKHPGTTTVFCLRDVAAPSGAGHCREPRTDSGDRGPGTSSSGETRRS